MRDVRLGQDALPAPLAVIGRIDRLAGDLIRCGASSFGVAADGRVDGAGCRPGGRNT